MLRKAKMRRWSTIRYAVSAGVLVPDQQLIEDAIKPELDAQELTAPPRRPATTPARTADT